MFKIYFSETIHLLFGTFAFGLIIGSYMLTSCKKAFTSNIQHNYHAMGMRMIQWVLYLLLAQIFTGSLLVWLKNYPLGTPWIRDAYILVTSCILLLIYIRYRLSQYGSSLSTHLSYILTLIGLTLVIHDAVTRVSWL